MWFYSLRVPAWLLAEWSSPANSSVLLLTPLCRPFIPDFQGTKAAFDFSLIIRYSFSIGRDYRRPRRRGSGKREAVAHLFSTVIKSKSQICCSYIDRSCVTAICTCRGNILTIICFSVIKFFWCAHFWLLFILGLCHWTAPDTGIWNWYSSRHSQKLRSSVCFSSVSIPEVITFNLKFKSYIGLEFVALLKMISTDWRAQFALVSKQTVIKQIKAKNN